MLIIDMGCAGTFVGILFFICIPCLAIRDISRAIRKYSRNRRAERRQRERAEYWAKFTEETRQSDEERRRWQKENLPS